MDTKQTIIIFRKDLLPMRNLLGTNNVKVLQNGSRQSVVELSNVNLERFPFEWYPFENSSGGK